MTILKKLLDGIDNYPDRRFSIVVIVCAILGVPIHLFSAFEFYNFNIIPLVLINVIGAFLFTSLIYFVIIKKLKFAIYVAMFSVISSSIMEVYYVGWDGGYQYYILIIIPIFLMYTRWKVLETSLIMLAVFSSYLGCYFVGDYFPTVYQLGDEVLNEANLINFIAVFATFILVISFFSFSIGKMESDLTSKNLELYKSNEDNKLLLKELHHRVKNNLHVVNSIMELQKSEIKDQNLIYYIEDAQQRIISMATLHEKMYGAENMKEVPLEKYLISLFKDLVKIFDKKNKVDIDQKCDDVFLGLDALAPLTFLLNEIITNSFKHAFPEGSISLPKIYCYVKDEGKKVSVEVGDNGLGLKNKNDNSERIGISLIESFLTEVEAKYEILNKDGLGYKFTFNKNYSIV